MAYEQRDNSGSLFFNEEQREGKNDPDRQGSAVIDGRAYWVAGWIKKPEGKKQFLSLAFTPKDKNRQSRKSDDPDAPPPTPRTPPPPSRASQPPERAATADDPDIPF